MSEANVRFNQLNLVVEDMDAAVAFYQALGMTVRFDGGEWPPGSGARHVALDNGEGAIFELDNLAMAAAARWSSASRCRPEKRSTSATRS
jgi:catechol 2,3-dioxygenase-like lactoylglutathione lyase family enzyme